MSEEVTTWCRHGECMAALTATVSAGRLEALRPAEDQPSGKHGACGICTASVNAARDPRRLLRPKRRTASGSYEEVDWATAIREIGAALKQTRKQSGANAIATYAGAPVGTNSQGLTRTLAWALGVGSPNLFSPLSTTGGPWVRAGELMLGHPVALQGDVGRAHYVLLLGANAEAQGYGPLQAGRNLSADLAFSRKTKGTKVVAADARTTPIAAAADVHVKIRPGTELFFLLGVLDQVVKNKWHEKQYVADFTEGFDALSAAVSEWPIERVAPICGVTPEEIAGVALKFCRAAMAVAHRSPQMLASEHGTLAAWATIALHGLTANLLRPGGLYDNKGVLDPHPVVAQLPTEKAPRLRVSKQPLLLMQAPGAALLEEITTPGEGQVRALVSIHGDPARDLPGGDRLREALAGLDLLVAIDVAENDTTAIAHWVLPSVGPWERADLHLHDTSILPHRELGYTPALDTPPGEARDEAEILRELFGALGPTVRGGAFGPHLRILGAWLAGAALSPWEERLLEFSGQTTLAELKEKGLWFGGEVDRATFRVSTPNGKIQLFPPAIAAAIAALRPPEAPAGLDRWLQLAAARDCAVRRFDRAAGADPGVFLHPDAGFAEGDRVRIRTQAGSVEATVHLDAGLRPDTVDLPAGYAVDAMRLVPADRVDALSGAPCLAGLPCAVEKV